jgi:hypothetical protein
MGAGGIKINHEWYAPHDGAVGKTLQRREGMAPSMTTVSDCSIHDGSLIWLSAVGIWIGNAGHNREI